MEPVVHAAFQAAAFGCLKQVFHGRDGHRIILLRDNLAVGAIDRTDGEARTQWLRKQLGDDVATWSDAIDAFWSDVASPEHRVVAWVSRRDAHEHTGLLEAQRRRGDAPLEIVDVSDIEVEDGERRPALARSVAEIAPAEVMSRGLFDSAAVLSEGDARRDAQTWARLREENAPLRVFENGVLVSAPIDHYDARLLAAATAEWKPTMQMLGPFYSAARADGLGVPDLRFVESRLVALVEAGQLEAQGDLSTFQSWTQSSLRRAR